MANKIKYLESIRGLGAIIVFMCHLFAAFFPVLVFGLITPNISHLGDIEQFIRYTPFNLLYNGDFAVCVFFVLSGYVLTYQFFKTGNSETLISGAARRYIRLFIPVFFVILISFIFLSLSLYHNKEASKLTSSIAWLGTLYSFQPNIIQMFEQGIWGTFFGGQNSFDFGQNSYDLALWTMSIEFFGSMLVFSLSSLFGKLKGRSIMYTAAIFFFLNTYYLGFILGMLFADLHNNKRTMKMDNGLIIMLLLGAGFFFGSYLTNGNYGDQIYQLLETNASFLPYDTLFYHTIGASLIILAILNSNILKKILSHPVLVFFGKISFSLYLIHVIIICSFSSFLFILLHNIIPYNLNVIVVIVATVPLTIFISLAFSKLIDENGVRLSHELYEKYLRNEEAFDWHLSYKKALKAFNETIYATIVEAKSLYNKLFIS